MTRNSLRTLLIVLALLSTLPAFAQENVDPGEALYGEWEVVEMIFHSTVQDFRGGNGGWFQFEPGGFRRLIDAEHRRMLENKRVKASMTERCLIRPREIDILTKFFGREETWQYALYELKDEKLRIVWPQDHGPRPTHFDAMKDRNLTLFVLKKVK